MLYYNPARESGAANILGAENRGRFLTMRGKNGEKKIMYYYSPREKKRKRSCLRHLLVREQVTIYDIQVPREEGIPYLEQYHQYLEVERGLGPHTIRRYLAVLQQFALYMKGHHHMEPFNPWRVNPNHVRRFLAYLKNQIGNSPSTRNSKLGSLDNFYRFLVCCQKIDEDDNPLNLIRRARLPSRVPVYLTLEEVNKILQAAVEGEHALRDVALLRVLVQAGLRPIELLTLRVQDIDFNDRCLLIHGKGNKQRLVPLTVNTERALQDYLAVRYPLREFTKQLFLDSRGKPYTGCSLRNWFKRLCREAGVEKKGISVGKLRHTCLILLHQEGADIVALRDLAGHKSVKTTQGYIHVTQKMLRKALLKYPLG